MINDISSNEKNISFRKTFENLLKILRIVNNFWKNFDEKNKKLSKFE